VRNRVALASLYATHPLSRERAATLREAAGSMPRLAARAPDRHLDVIAPHIDAWLDADIAERDFGRSLHLLDQLAKRGLPQSVINLHRGDAYRLRDGEGDAEAALTAYRSAISEPDVPARAYRELGMMLRALGRRPREAAEALRSYLDLDPGAADRAFIEHYIEDLERLS
jgi:tetratricopeptide (TPR) repeat protein